MFIYNDDGYREKMAACWRKSRADARMSQENIAAELGVTRKTVQNWEKGVSAPDIRQAIEWFRVLHVSPLPYLFQYVFPLMENINAEDEDEKIREALLLLITDLPPEGVRQLLYLFYGDHGSSPRAVLNMVTAHLQSPLRDRIAHAHMAKKDYELAVKMNTVTATNHIQPNVKIIDRAIEEAEKTILVDEKSYML